MPRFVIGSFPSEPYVDYYLLEPATAAGNFIGYYLDHEISDVVRDEYGHRYNFVGLAPHKTDGRYDVRQLKAGEVIVQPGLLYRLIPAKRSWFG